jgi:NADPH:quinone reductase-like Zn-dependent oxidoreductase
MKLTMKAAYINKRPHIGQLSNDILVSDDIVPKVTGADLKENEVLVKVKASSVNIDDINVTQGSFLGGIPGMQSEDSYPYVVGSDFAGEVVAIGEKVKSIKVGQRVCGLNKRQTMIAGDNGTWAEYAPVPEKNVIVIPNDDISFPTATASVMPLFVIQGLLDSGKLSGTEKVVVIGASGGIGSLFVKVLRKLHPDLYIIGVCSTRNLEFVKSIGANDTIDYTKSSIGDIDMDIDRVFDLIGGEKSYAKSFDILRQSKGKYITCVGPIEWIGDEMVSFGGKLLFVSTILWKSILNRLPGKHPNYEMMVSTELKEEIFHFVFNNKIEASIEKIIPFNEDGVKEAVKLVESHRAKGKVVFEM